VVISVPLRIVIFLNGWGDVFNTRHELFQLRRRRNELLL
jgi:hypothetical protein